jgi:hypothetical protein
MVEASHREPAAAWFGTGQVSSSDGQHFYLGGEGETGGTVNARYGRDPIIKLYTHISDRYAPFHVKVNCIEGELLGSGGAISGVSAKDALAKGPTPMKEEYKSRRLSVGDILNFVESKNHLTSADKATILASCKKIEGEGKEDNRQPQGGPVTKEEHLRVFKALRNMFKGALRMADEELITEERKGTTRLLNERVACRPMGVVIGNNESPKHN